MCHSKAQGGQRCFGHAAATLAGAEDNYRLIMLGQDTTDTPAGTADTITDGNTDRTPASVRLLRAYHALEDARTRYASTPQGEADLTARLDKLTQAYRSAAAGPVTRDTVNAASVINAYTKAISDGVNLRARAKEIANNVKTGALTEAQATRLAVFPSEEVAQWRKVKLGWLQQNADDATRDASDAETRAARPVKEERHPGPIQNVLQAMKMHRTLFNPPPEPAGPVMEPEWMATRHHRPVKPTWPGPSGD